MMRTLIVLLCVIAGYQPLMLYAATTQLAGGTQTVTAKKSVPDFAPFTPAELQALQTKASSNIALCHLAGGDCTRVCDKTDPVTHQPICHQQCDQPQASDDSGDDILLVMIIVGVVVLAVAAAASASTTTHTAAALMAH